MNNMVLNIFENDSQAEDARRFLLARERKNPIGIDDLVIVEKTGDSELKFRHFSHLTLNGGIAGAFLGLLFGILLLNPIFALAGLLIGFLVGSITGAFSHIGIDREFMREQVGAMLPGNAALFVMDRDNTDKILAQLKNFDQAGGLLQKRICTQTRDLRECATFAGVGNPLPAGGNLQVL